MNKANRYATLGSIVTALTLVTLVVIGLSIALIYRFAYQQQLHDMKKEVEGLAELMESVAQFDRRFSTHTHPQGSSGATLSLIENGLKARSAIFSSEEIYLGRQVGDKLVVLRVHPSEGFKEFTRVSFDGQLAQGLYRALHDNEHGSGQVTDFLDRPALTAYAPVPSLGIAVVNHITLNEFRAPFVRAAFWVTILGLLFAGLTSAALNAYTRPLQRRLEESERRSTARSAAAPVGVYETDTAGHCIYVNDRWCELAGMSRDEVLGDGWLRALHPDDTQKVYAAWQEFIARRAPFNLEYRFLLPSGEVRWLSGQAVALTDASGKITGYTGTITDITALILAKVRFDEAQRLAKIGSWELDLQTNHLLWSDEIFCIFEIDKARFSATYEAFLNAIHPEDRAAVNAAYTGSLADRKPYEIVHRLQMSDGRIKHVRETCESFFDDEGKPLRSVGTVQDITELHQAELQLREYRDHLEDLVTERAIALKQTSQMLQAVLDTVPLRIFWKDRDLNYLGCNRVFAADAGKDSPQELIGKSDYDMAWKATADLYRQDDAEVIATGREKLSFEEPMELPDGSRIWLSTSKVPLRDIHGVVTGVLGTYENITARKQTEQALIAAKNEAERANRAKSEFLSRMSHELRTPMNAILGFAQILELDPLKPDQLDSVHEIHRAGDHLLELINELLDLSRIESGKMSIALQPVGVKAAIAGATQIIQPLLKANNISLLDKCNDQATVLADPTRLKQVLLNLLSNAAKYSHKGGQVQISCHPLDASRLRISVTDNGPGIPSEKLASLFTPFERLGAEFSAIDGTGIGLALAKQLTELMGGELDLDSIPGEGSTFWIELASAAHQSAETTHMLTDDVATSSASQPLSLLYIEDNPANLRLVEALLRHHPQIRLLTAITGELGLDMARRYQPGLILLDIHLPGMDGYAVLEALKAEPGTRNIPVIALSADAMSYDIERGLHAGFNSYLTKPVHLSELMKAVEEALRANIAATHKTP
jgi:PAS domain S-box-containing protein